MPSKMNIIILLTKCITCDLKFLLEEKRHNRLLKGKRAFAKGLDSSLLYGIKLYRNVVGG